jgi:hypothetical protein
MGEMRNACRILGEDLEGKIPLGTLGIDRRIIKIVLKEKGYGDMDWI